jgi:hypothetical protein
MEAEKAVVVETSERVRKLLTDELQTARDRIAQVQTITTQKRTETDTSSDVSWRAVQMRQERTTETSETRQRLQTLQQQLAESQSALSRACALGPAQFPCVLVVLIGRMCV